MNESFVLDLMKETATTALVLIPARIVREAIGSST